jgi:hypothetical protein
MAIRNHTGIVPYRLHGSQGERQRFTPGGELSFLLKSIKAVTDGKLCNYVLGIAVTVYGSIVMGDVEAPPQHGSALGRNSIRTMWDIMRMLVGSVEVCSAWHGTPLSPQHVKGSYLQLLETLGNGLERPYRVRAPLQLAVMPGPEVPQPRRHFRHTFFLPLSLLAGQKGHHTALPAVCYENAELKINCGSGTNQFGDQIYTCAPQDQCGPLDCYFEASALILPEDEVRVGPCVQWIDYQQKVSGEAIDINGLGSVTTCNRVERGAGIAGLFWVSNRLGLPGPAQVRDLTDVTFPFRGVIHTKHLDPIITQLETIMGCKQDVAGELVGDSPDGSLQGSGDVGGFPYDDYDYGVTEQGVLSPAAARLPPNPVVLPLVCPSKDLEATKVQVSEGTQQVQLQFRDGTVGDGTHHVLACQLHSWTPEGWASVKQLLIERGVCRAVLGTDDVDWSLKVIRKQDPARITARKRRFFAMRLLPTENADVKVS